MSESSLTVLDPFLSSKMSAYAQNRVDNIPGYIPDANLVAEREQNIEIERQKQAASPPPGISLPSRHPIGRTVPEQTITEALGPFFSQKL